ncbi:hypothetical protein BU23DRAFT_490068 [Bimuria novae-zelandiae CBS 107.79]|uniref:GILT-domain-containing protein n=1 Tax=Bimuria novae-zelandiae CBS 107.79 TaxID=1447943 RepID=A0A6A5UW49_9PLEO|nr:hypothetical protein BU23DRAFT_490068 [Bimuria novae-zelandiae CBS 107.79]
MENKSLLPQTEEPTPQRPAPPKYTTRFHGVLLALVLAGFWLASSWTCGHEHMHQETSSKVPLEIHIMSKCPDARDCIEKLVVPAMANVSEKVDFKLSFIGKTTDDDGVICKHGQTECLGNILELCAASEYPDPKIYLGFTRCLVQRYEEIPATSLIKDCALEYGIEFEKLNDCASRDDGAYGMGMLRDSVTRSSELGVSTSCTVRLDGKTRCVRDGGKWRDCEGGSEPEDLVSDIEKLFDETRGRTE